MCLARYIFGDGLSVNFWKTGIEPRDTKDQAKWNNEIVAIKKTPIPL